MAKQNRTSGSGAPSSHGVMRLGGLVAVALMAAACGSAAGSGAGAATPSTTPVAQATAATDRTVTSAPSTAAPTAAPTAAATATPLPAIVVAHPMPGETVHSPFHVSGTADTFEATFRVQVRDGAGRVLVDQQVHATSGTGTRGSFDTVVTTAARGTATLVAYELSARDGSQVNTVTVPITLG